MNQSASVVLMVPPTYFGFNAETAGTNSFQHQPDSTEAPEEINRRAHEEFEQAVKQLTEVKIQVIRLASPENAPDAVFPNNWFSTDDKGRIILYQMATPNRQLEVQPAQLEVALKKAGFLVTTFLSQLADPPLEGTGSLVFDHRGKIAYAAISPRTHPLMANQLCNKIGYELIMFETDPPNNQPVYHTNVMMSIGEDFAVACLECIPSSDRTTVRNSLLASGRQIIEISWEQAQHFAGNILGLANQAGRSFVVMSQSAYNAFTCGQLQDLVKLGGPVIPIKIPTIEKVSGGSIRCMLAEIFLPRARR